MPRGYRHVLVTAFVWLALTGQTSPASDGPEQRQETVERQRSADTQRAAETVASAVREAIRLSEEDRGCEQGYDQRQSDLCAQWKAADAAHDSAKYALWTFVASVVGTGLLIWTLWDTRANARRELRAYVSIEPGLFSNHVRSDGSRRISLELKMKNGGVTPAYRAVYAGNVVAMSEKAAHSYFRRNNENDPRVGEPTPTVVHSGEAADIVIEAHEPFTAKQIADLRAGTLILYAFGFVEYTDTFGANRSTKF